MPKTNGISHAPWVKTKATQANLAPGTPHQIHLGTEGMNSIHQMGKEQRGGTWTFGFFERLGRAQNIWGVPGFLK